MCVVVVTVVNIVVFVCCNLQNVHLSIYLFCQLSAYFDVEHIKQTFLRSIVGISGIRILCKSLVIKFFPNILFSYTISVKNPILLIAFVKKNSRSEKHELENF